MPSNNNEKTTELKERVKEEKIIVPYRKKSVFYDFTRSS